VQNSLQASIDAVSRSLTNHVGDWNNPHRTTAAQAGTYTSQQIDAMISALNNALTGYVKKHVGEELALTSGGGQLMAFVGGGWKVIWPAQWS
jgi:hypothetical protein